MMNMNMTDYQRQLIDSGEAVEFPITIRYEQTCGGYKPRYETDKHPPPVCLKNGACARSEHVNKLVAAALRVCGSCHCSRWRGERQCGRYRRGGCYSRQHG